MWMNHTIATGEPSDLAQAVELMTKPEVREAFTRAPGFRSLYLNINLDDPGEVISISVWDSPEQGQAFYSGPEYKQILGSARHLVKAVGRKSFAVRMEHLAVETQPA